MQTLLEKEKQKIDEKAEQVNKMMKGLEVKKSEAKKVEEEVLSKKEYCERNAAEINVQKQEAEKDLANALPFLQKAVAAANNIKPADIGEIKTLKAPSDIIKLVMDGVLLLQFLTVDPVKELQLTISKEKVDFLCPSFDPHAKLMFSDARFLQKI